MLEGLTTRRRFVWGSVAAAAACAIGAQRHARAQPRLDTVRLSETLLAVIGPDATSLAVAGTEGIIVVDGGSAAWSDALLARIEATFVSKPITALFNTHWHPEQTGSNVALGERGAQIIAHENTKLWLGTEIAVQSSGSKHPPLPAAGLPTITFLESGSMKLSGRALDHHYLLNAHTDGDICLFLPDDNTLVTGGAVSNDGWPTIDWWTGGWIGGMLDAYDTILEIANDETVILPSRGPVMSLAELETQREMYLIIFDRLQSMLRQSFGTEEVLLARPTAEFDARWGKPDEFLTLAFQSLWGHIRDVRDTRLRTIP